jgi:hypothetical protein
MSIDYRPMLTPKTASAVARTKPGLRSRFLPFFVSFFHYLLDDVEILAVQVEMVEGRQSDQECRHTAVHADIEAARA